MTATFSFLDVESYFLEFLQPDQILKSETDKKTYGTDWTKVYTPNPCAILFPKTTLEVSKILKFCHSRKIPVVPSGGRTGLVGGAVAKDQEIVLSLEKMNKLLQVDSVGLTISAEAGVTTQALQEAAAEVGLLFPLDLAAKGTSQIGGNIATNAGGVKLIRYGGTREQVLGIEVVLADGEVLDLNTSLRKNNSGYDLKQLFIGSEGTLGIITQATLKLVPKPKNMNVSIMAVEKFSDIPEILRVVSKRGLTVTAFEFFTDIAHTIVLKYQTSLKTPFDKIHPYYVLLEIEDGDNLNQNLEALLESLFEHSLISDAAIAANSAQFKDFWGLRENITESLSMHGHVRKNDISLPIDQLNNFVKDLNLFLQNLKSPIELVLFGHIGDGNLHINYVTPKTNDFKVFQTAARTIELEIFKLLTKFKGSISAEHGIGLTKKEDLHFTRQQNEIEWMKSLKKTFDPLGILNPGKIF